MLLVYADLNIGQVTKIKSNFDSIFYDFKTDFEYRRSQRFKMQTQSDKVLKELRQLDYLLFIILKNADNNI